MMIIKQARRQRPEVRPPPSSLGATRRDGSLRGLVHHASRYDGPPLVTAHGKVFVDPTACERCGAIFFHKAWRKGRVVDSALLRRAAWDVCPACRQIEHGEYFGRVVIRGPQVAGLEAEILRRIAHVAARAEFTQPERRVVEVRHQGEALEVHTTSQKLAHRIVCELEKAFGGSSHFAWSGRDGRLFATWEM